MGPEANLFKRGDIVAVIIVPGCAEADCSECVSGLPQLCRQGPRYGGGQDGFFAPYVKVTERAAIKLPPNVSVAAGAVATDACMTAYHAVVGRARVTRGETVLIFGLGGLGFNALQIALHLGARVIVSDKRQAVLNEAKRIGVRDEDIVSPDTEEIGEWIRNREVRVDKAIDFVSVPATFSAATDSVRLGGTVVSVGLLSSELNIATSKMVRRELTILGSYAGTISDVKACLDLISQGHLVPQVEEGSMGDFPTILEDLHHGKFKGRIVLIPDNDV
ncbi:hypothetical protein LTR84_006522 [Exophiala bonariae]|uniref:Enoyl reductase (ER) domain-containing protein n=1 Tax=Exophiala bonariae TaxID=1690606 RepID=A0AAV9N0A9_9EURO|nr:hypothetical protein LTR84_006522 [Exophiala bonariae]